MEFNYTPQMGMAICEHEDKMLESYSEIVDNYANLFAKYNCILKVERGWHDSFKDMNTNQRLPFKNGYECYIYCKVERNGEIIRYEDKEGEVDYYELIASWNISSITRNWFELDVILCSETDDIEEDLNKFLAVLGKLS